MADMIIAIDGHAASGKGTIARQLAHALQYRYIDTGAMYRAITYYFLSQNMPINNEKLIQKKLQDMAIEIVYNPTTQQNETLLNGLVVDDVIRSAEVNQLVSQVASLKAVRELAVQQQQQMGKHKKIVMDGRDIGTKVFPDADVKFFITADLATRAKRRFAEMQSKGIKASYESVLENLSQRDAIDSSRSIDPLRKATDAIEINNTNLTPQQQFEQCLQIIKNKINQSSMT